MATAMLVTASIVVDAQNRKGYMELSVQTGTTSIGKIVAGLSYFGVEDVSFSNSGCTGPKFVNFRYYVTHRFSLGLTAGNQYIAYQMWNDGEKITTPSFSYSGQLTTIAGEMRYNYSNSKYFCAYGLLGFGETFFNLQKETNGAVVPQSGGTFQFTPIGLRIGNRFGVFGELGLGYKGLASGGIYFKFGTRGGVN